MPRDDGSRCMLILGRLLHRKTSEPLYDCLGTGESGLRTTRFEEEHLGKERGEVCVDKEERAWKKEGRKETHADGIGCTKKDLPFSCM